MQQIFVSKGGKIQILGFPDNFHSSFRELIEWNVNFALQNIRKKSSNTEQLLSLKLLIIFCDISTEILFYDIFKLLQ